MAQNTELRGWGEAQVRLERFVRSTGQIFWYQRKFLSHTRCVSAASGSGSAASPPGPPAQPSGPAAPPASSAAAGWTPAGWSSPSCSPPGAAERLEQPPRSNPENPSWSFPQEQNKGHTAQGVPELHTHTAILGEQDWLFSLGSSELSHLPALCFPKAPALRCCPQPQSSTAPLQPQGPYVSFELHPPVLIQQQLPPPLQGLLLWQGTVSEPGHC